MKVWYIIIFFIIFILSLTIISQHILIAATDDMKTYLDNIQKSVNNANYESAYNSFRTLKLKWNGYKARWAILVEHQEIDNIEEQITKIEKLLQTHSKSDLLCELSVLSFYVKHIKDMTSLEIENIF